jgi:hypothetical protein
MRKVLVLAVLLVVGSLASSPLSATSCNTTCAGTVRLGCTATTCSSSTGVSITCDGTTTTCSAAANYCACSQNCIDQCEASCDLGRPFICNSCINNCRQNNGCSTQPPFITQC